MFIWSIFNRHWLCSQTHRESRQDVPVDRPLDEAEDGDAVDDAELREERKLRWKYSDWPNQHFGS